MPAARARSDAVSLDLGTETATTLHAGLAARAERVLVVTWPMPDSVGMIAQRHRAVQHTAHRRAERCHLVITPTPRHVAAMRLPLDIITRVHAAGILLSRFAPRDGTLGGGARLGAEEVPLLRSDRAAWTSVFVRSVEGIVATVRPGMLPARPWDRGDSATHTHAAAPVLGRQVRGRAGDPAHLVPNVGLWGREGERQPTPNYVPRFPTFTTDDDGLIHRLRLDGAEPVSQLSPNVFRTVSA